MFRFRTKGVRATPWLAMVLAYALALQAILAVAIGAQHAAAATGSHDIAVICFGLGADALPDENGSPPKRLHQAPCSLCSVAASAADVPAAIEASRRTADVQAIAYALRLAPDAHPARPRSPRLSQGPPTIA